jgi:LytS/YehU family sensor histidine kinase
MIVQPYIENAIWHGLLQRPEGPPGKLWLRFAQMNEHTLRIEIEDNGIGRKKADELRSKDTIKSKSYGMQISKDRIQIINSQYHSQSSVTVEDLFDDAGNAVGTKVILHLPLIEMA